MLIFNNRLIIVYINPKSFHLRHTGGTKTLAKSKAIAEKSVYVVLTKLIYLGEKMRSVGSVMAHHSEKAILLILLVYPSLSVHFEPAVIVRRKFVVESQIYVCGDSDISLVTSINDLTEGITVTETGILLADLCIIVAEAHIASRGYIYVFYMRVLELIGKFLGIKVTENIVHSGWSVKIKMKGASEFRSYCFKHYV